MRTRATRTKLTKLQRRQADYDAMLARGFTDFTKDKRLKSGGYRRPGSNK